MAARALGKRYFLTDMKNPKPSSILVAGHRGLPLEYPDNTAEGILAASTVCDMVEFDVRRTRDGVAVLSHDAHLGGRAIIDMDWQAVAEVDVGGGLHPARLDDVLAAAGTFPFNFEIKNSPLDPDFDDTFGFAYEAASRASERDLVTSFHWPTVDAVRKAFPKLSTGLLVDPTGSLEGAIAWAVGQGHQAIAPHWSLLAGPSVVWAGQALQIVVWTVNDEEVGRRLAAGGATAIITDDPKRMAKALKGGKSDDDQG
jgi:glycerophosphoryl diester phosphodiesterase